MRINFFEEFPETGSLEKARRITFPTTIYIAARSFSSFLSWKEKLATISPLAEAAYWPILEKSYWVSPVAYTDELQTLAQDLASNQGNQPLKVLVDLELPLTKNLHISNIPSFFKNRNIIKSIFATASANNIEILTSEYPSPNWFFQLIWKLLGLSYDRKQYPHQRIIMYYSSMLRGADRSREWLVRNVRRFIRSTTKKNPELQIGLGTIDVGILGTEPILPAPDLASDLQFLKETAIQTAVIFRLSGVTEEYLQTIRPYLD